VHNFPFLLNGGRVGDGGVSRVAKDVASFGASADLGFAFSSVATPPPNPPPSRRRAF
jgi:hypothetical protein